MRKIPRHYPIYDDCNTSMRVLYEKVEGFFSSTTGEDYFYSDYFQGADKTWSRPNETLNVISWGDTFRKMFQSGSLIHPQIKIWNIATSFQRMQNQLLFKGEDIVNLIPRYKLFKNKSAAAPDLKKGLDLIYAGRISYQKNVPFLLYFADALNTYGVNCRVHLYGAPDQRIHEHMGRWKPESIKKTMEYIREELASNCEIIEYGFVDNNEWLKKQYDQPVVVSMSTFFGEDFGVSLAQAQEEGLPILCSQFGGHKDLLSQALAFIPSYLIGNSHLPLDIQKILAKRAVKFLLEEKGFCEITPLADNKEGRVLNLEELDSFRRKLIKDVGSSVFWLNKDSLDDFSDTRNGGLLVRKALDILDTPTTPGQQEVSIILSSSCHDLLDSNDKDFINEGLQGLPLDTRIHFLFDEELFYPDNTLLLKRSHKAIYSQKVNQKVKNFVKELF